MNYGHGWDKIGDKSSVDKLYDFFSPNEQKVIWKHYRERPATAGKRYLTEETMRWEESLEDMIHTVTVVIHGDRWPHEAFRTSMCVAGNEKRLYEHSALQKLIKAKRELQTAVERKEKIIKQLQNEKRNANKRKTHKQRAAEKRRREELKRDQGNTEGHDEEPEMEIPDQASPQDPRLARAAKNQNKNNERNKGKRDPACVDCLKKGCGLVHHAKCDKTKQQQRIVSMANAQNKPQSW